MDLSNSSGIGTNVQVVIVDLHMDNLYKIVPLSRDNTKTRRQFELIEERIRQGRVPIER
jgi:hypothetical protein